MINEEGLTTIKSWDQIKEKKEKDYFWISDMYKFNKNVSRKKKSC